MATGTGLDAYLATKTEAAVGTGLTGTNFWAFNTAELTYDPTYIDNPGIMNGARFKDVNQAGIVRKAASGKLEVPVMMNGFGWWFKHIIGSTGIPVLDATTAYKQIHTPGGLRGISFTTQIGKPNPYDGSIALRSYNGCKVTDWDLTIADNAITLLDMSVDAWAEDSTGAPAAPGSIVYPTQPGAAAGVAGGAYNFSHVNTFQTALNDDGSKVTAAASLMSFTGGATPNSVITKLTLSGKNTLATDRYGLGNSGTKKEQLETDFCGITGAFEGEFDPTTWETPFVAGNTVAFHVTCQGPQIASTGKYYMLDIIIPAAKITKAPAPVSGPDIVKVSGEFEVYDPKKGTGATLVSPIQFLYESTDTAFV